MERVPALAAEGIAFGGVNLRYLMEAIDALKVDDVQIEFFEMTDDVPLLVVTGDGAPHRHCIAGMRI